MTEKVLVTGGAGYIGSMLTQSLLNYDLSVTVLDNLTYNQITLLDLCIDSNFTFINGDISDKFLMRKLLNPLFNFLVRLVLLLI